MYKREDAEKEKTLSEFKKLILDYLEDGVLKYPIKLLRKKIYLPLGLGESVSFYSKIWRGYVVLVEICVFVMQIKLTIDKELWSIVNILIIAFFVAMKFVWRLCKKRSKKEVKRSNAYEQDRVTKQWFLKERNKKQGNFWFCGMLSWFFIYIGIYTFFDEVKAFQYIYPAVFIVFFYENWLQYEWMTREEYYKSEVNEIPKRENEKTMFIMQQELKENMPSGYFLEYEASRDEKPILEEEIDAFLEGNSHAKKLLRVFCTKRKDISKKDFRLLGSAKELLEGHSVLFTTSFYKDMDYAFLLPAYLKMIKGETILLVCSTKISTEEILTWMRNEINEMNGLDWWRYDAYQPFGKPGNVLAVYCTDFVSFCVDSEYADFRSKIGLIFLQEPAEYTEDCIRKIRMLHNKRQEKGEICLAVSSGTMNSLDLLNWGFLEKNVFGGQMWRPAKRRQVMYWREKDITRNERDAGNWGIEMELLRYLLKEVPAERIVWVGGGLLPVWDVLWAYKRFCDIHVDNHIVLEDYGYNLQLNDETYIIAEDFLGNYRKTAELFSSRGSDKSQVHVIVPEYLLREYMREKPKDKLLREGLNRKEIISERNMVWSIFLELLEGWVPVKRICEELTIYMGNGPFSISDLEEKIKKYISGSDSISIESRYIGEDCCHIYADETIKSILKNNSNLKFCMDGEDKELDIITELTYNTLFQKHLPGQHIVLGNKSYQFLGILDRQDKFLIRVKRNSSMVCQKTYYRQMREYELGNVTAAFKKVTRTGNLQMTWEFEEADITVKTSTYLELSGLADYNQFQKCTCNNVPSRKYLQKRYIKIEIPENEEEVLRTVATWLREAFYSLCPEDRDYLAVCVKGCTDSGSISNITFTDGGEADSKGYIYILEDRENDSGILQDIFEKQDSILDTFYEYMGMSDTAVLGKLLVRVS